MLRKYVVTGTPPFLIDGERIEAGEVIELPVQMADHPLAMGAITLAPPDAVISGAPAAAPPKPAEPAAPKKKAKAKK